MNNVKKNLNGYITATIIKIIHKKILHKLSLGLNYSLLFLELFKKILGITNIYLERFEIVWNPQ